jgi:clan AA aspartic protease
MTGYVDRYLQPKVRLAVKGLRQTLPIEVVVDTGFNGDLCLPIPFAIQLGLELCADREFELADGSIRQELIFIGQAVLENEERDVLISLTHSADALLGCGLLKGQKLEIGFESKTLNIAPETNGNS